MTNQPRNPIRILAVAAVLALGALAWAPAALAAGTITGKVIDGTTREPAAGLEVTLRLFGPQSELTPLTATTGDDGTFAFSDVDAGATSYQVTATYEGITFQTQLAALDAGGAEDVRLNVYQTTSDPADVAQASWRVWVDRENGGVAIQHDIDWENNGDEAYVGNQVLDGGTPAVVSIPLAPGSGSFQFLGTFLDVPGTVQGSSYVNPAPIPPGTSTATLRYTVPSLTRLTLPVELLTRDFRLFVPTGIEVSSAQLTPGGQVQDQGLSYQVFTATDLQPGDTIEVTTSGLTGGTSSSPVLAFALAGLLFVAAVGGFLFWRRMRAAGGPARARAAARRPARDSGARQGRGNGRSTRAPARVGRAPRAEATGANGQAVDEIEIEEEAELLIQEIAALDMSFERGLLDQHTYERLRGAAKRRLLGLRGAPTDGRPAR